MSDRKYSHRGYQDEDRRDERREDRRPPDAGPRERPEGPRGRGLGAPTVSVSRCRVCGTRQQVSGPVALDAVCASCGGDLHTCSNCAYFDTSRPNECRKPILQRVTNKTKRNACELFAPSTVQEFASDRPAAAAPDGSMVDSPRAAFDALFKKK